jgi:hypothetical protein
LAERFLLLKQTITEQQLEQSISQILYGKAMLNGPT